MNKKFEKKEIGIDRPFTQLFLLFVLIGLGLFLTMKSPYFLKWNNIRNILDHSALQIIMALSMTFVISSQGIDLSIGSMVALSGLIIGLSMKSGFSIPLSILIGLLSGCLMGLLNGLIISKLKIVPYVVTIGSMSLFRGLSLVITKGQPIYGFPIEFTYIGKGDFGKINPPIIMAFFMVLESSVL